jgi:hypothetical protein
MAIHGNRRAKLRCKRAVSSWHMSAEDVKRYKDAEPVPWTLEIRKSVGSMSDFSPWRNTSDPDATLKAHGSSSDSAASKE